MLSYEKGGTLTHENDTTLTRENKMFNYDNDKTLLR